MSRETLEIALTANPDAGACAEIETFVQAQDSGHFQQYVRWAAIDTEVPGARYRLLAARRHGRVVGTALVRHRTVRGLPVRIAEVCGGPVATSAGDLGDILRAVIEDTTATGAMRLEVRPYLPEETTAAQAAQMHACGLVQPLAPRAPATLEVDLTAGDEAILASFRKGTRADVRRAVRDGVTVREAGGTSDAALFQTLYDSMDRKGATPRPAPFFAGLFAFIEEDTRRGFALLAEHEGRAVGGTVILHHGGRGIYAFGASDPAGPPLPKGHLLQYEAMRLARRRGALVYDLGGFTGGVGTAEQRTPAQKVNLWKSGFRGNVRPLLPPRSRILRPVLHGLEQLARRVAGQQ